MFFSSSLSSDRELPAASLLVDTGTQPGTQPGTTSRTRSETNEVTTPGIFNPLEPSWSGECSRGDFFSAVIVVGGQLKDGLSDESSLDWGPPWDVVESSRLWLCLCRCLGTLWERLVECFVLGTLWDRPVSEESKDMICATRFFLRFSLRFSGRKKHWMIHSAKRQIEWVKKHII